MVGSDSPEPDRRLQGKVAIVTGAGPRKTSRAGIGQAIAVLLAREGAKVVLVNREGKHAEIVLDQIKSEGGEAVICEGDVSKPADCERMAETAVGNYGGLHVLVNNAAQTGSGSVVDTTLEDWDNVIAINLTGAMLTSRYAVPRMIASGGGSIINITSTAALRGFMGAASYCASKAGMHGLALALAVHHGRDNIRANCIAPGHAYTAMSGDLDDEHRAIRNKSNPLGTEGTAWDIAWAAVYLASDESKWVTGTTIPVEGGLLTPLPTTVAQWLGAPRVGG